MVLKEIEKYKENFIVHEECAETDIIADINELIARCEVNLEKQKKALEVVNDAYEFGDYSREEWIKRKKKWEAEIYNSRNTIYELKKQARKTVQITDTDRLNNLNAFFENITQTIDSATRNDLYRTIIDSIIWQRSGDDSKINIKFK